MKYFKILVIALAVATFSSCTSDFDEINTNPHGFTKDDVSAKFFLTGVQVNLYAPSRYAYWRAHLIHSDRYAGHFTFGHTASWWNDGLGYNFSGSYTDATYGWMSGQFGKVKGFADLVKDGADLENKYMYAVSLILKSLSFQMYTDTFGMIPFSEAGVEGILTPKYDAQKDVYKGIIADLDQAMTIIGNETKTGVGVDDLGSNDLFCGGDLQKWKRLANTLKLRIAMRALGAPGDDFASTTIAAALSAPLLDDTTGSITMKKDYNISKWASAAYGDVWNDFGGGSDWTMGATLLNTLINNNDPRLEAYASPAKGGSFDYTDDGSDTNFQDRVDFIKSALTASGANFTETLSVDANGNNVVTLDVPAGQFIGQPTRINGDTKPYVRYDMFSTPSDAIKQRRNENGDGYPEIVLTSAEAYFLRAEAVVRGLTAGNAQELFQKGIAESMKLWGVNGDNYLATSPLANITGGTMEEKLEKIAIQRWIADYTDGFEAWAVVRDTGYPTELANGVANNIIFEPGNLNGDYPQRMRYGSGAQANPNYNDAISVQGPDVQATKLWYAN